MGIIKSSNKTPFFKPDFTLIKLIFNWLSVSLHASYNNNALERELCLVLVVKTPVESVELKSIANANLDPVDLQTALPWRSRSRAPDTPQWQPPGSSDRRRWCPTRRFSAPPPDPRQPPRPLSDAPAAAAIQNQKKKSVIFILICACLYFESSSH